MPVEGLQAIFAGNAALIVTLAPIQRHVSSVRTPSTSTMIIVKLHAQAVISVMAKVKRVDLARRARTIATHALMPRRARSVQTRSSCTTQVV